jgi:DNA-binding transcriptional regulator YdaS (Cro superfamily)
MKNTKRYTEEEARMLLSRRISEAGSQAAFADSHGISRQYLTDVLKGRRDMSGKILTALELDKVTQYQPKAGNK